MNPLLILREEIVCLIILGFFWVHGYFYQLGKDSRGFLRFGIFATGTAIFDILTVLTVNRPDRVPAAVNNLAHILFYYFDLLFAHEFFLYVVGLCLPRSVAHRLKRLTLIPITAIFLLLPALPFAYPQGNGTYYNYGAGAITGYVLSGLPFLASLVLILVKRKSLESHVLTALVPMVALIVLAELVQATVPELLLTGGIVTFATVGFFFSMENPNAVFRQKLLFDAMTGVKSRNSYEIDMQAMEEEFSRDRRLKFGFVFFDLNNLKSINDRYGHMEGDRYIGLVAQALSTGLRSAENLYRMGGDEFLAIYRGQEECDILQEVAEVQSVFRGLESPYPVCVAAGCAVSAERYTSLKDVVKVADYIMYRNKTEQKRETAYLPGDGQQLDITGLTDRIFDAVAASGEQSYLILSNITTNVTRCSPVMVEYFGLPGEFIFDFRSVWKEHIHPDDLGDYRSDVGAVLSGKKGRHEASLRIRTATGEYVRCTSRGTVVKGSGTEPDIFAVTIINHGVAERFDPITGLCNEAECTHYVERILRDRTVTTFLIFSITGFGRVNLLHGVEGGNEVLRQFAAEAAGLVTGNARLFRLAGPRFLLCIPGFGARQATRDYRALQNLGQRGLELAESRVSVRLAGGAFILNEYFVGDITTVRNDLLLALDSSRNERQGQLVFCGGTAEGYSSDFRLLTAIHHDAVFEKKGFFLRYQPIVRMSTGKVVGAEALLRWRDANRGEVGPDAFVPWLENDPCFFWVGQLVLKQAMTDAARFRELCPDFRMSVNVTVLQLEDDRFCPMLTEVLEETGFPPGQLCLELTERCRELNPLFLRNQMESFHRLGVKVALDDFGTGFSSLDMLQKLPVDEVKLDQSFIRDIRTSEVNRIFARAIIAAADSMGCSTCLEGVEDARTLEHLKPYGARLCQGYFFSRPLLPEDLAAMIRRERIR